MIEVISKAIYGVCPLFVSTPDGVFPQDYDEALKTDLGYIQICRNQASAVLDALQEAGYRVTYEPYTYYGEGPGGPNPSKNEGEGTHPSKKGEEG